MRAFFSACAALAVVLAFGPPTGAAAQTPSFDHTLLTLSWAPSFCANTGSRPTNRECAVGGEFGFIVHGLWPSSSQENSRDICPVPTNDKVAPEIIHQMRSLMPDAYLVYHEWRTHGSCSGMTQVAYFQAIRTVMSSLIIPTPFQGPTASFQTTATALKAAFIEANRTLEPLSVKIGCKNGNLSQVQICLGPDARTPRKCVRQDRSCGLQPFVVLPVH